MSDSRVEISNNAAERSMKPPVLGRKNYLFCRSDAGGQRSGCMYTIIETAKLSAINPKTYLTDILASIASDPARRIDELLSWSWKG